MKAARYLRAFLSDVGPVDPVVPVGGRSQWTIGGAPLAAAREVVVPSGVVDHDADEMTVRCLAGTTVAEIDAVAAERGQCSTIDATDPALATVGGVLAVGQSGLRRLRYGPVRDVLLEARYITSQGRLVRAGAPLAKNVSGYDLCRLLVGSLGTLGILAEVVLRLRPRPVAAQWYTVERPPNQVFRELYEPSAVLWDGARTHVLLEGELADLRDEARRLALVQSDAPPPLPTGARAPFPLGTVPSAPCPFVAEIGVGILHLAEAPARTDPGRSRLHARIKESFDPVGRLNPGRVA